MKSRTLIIILGLLIILLAIWGITQRVNKPKGVILGLEKVTTDSFDTVELSRGDKKITLNKTGNSWQVDGFPVGLKKLDNLWEELSKVKISGPVSRNTQNHEKLEVSEAKALKVVFKQGENVKLT